MGVLAPRVRWAAPPLCEGEGGAMAIIQSKLTVALVHIALDAIKKRVVMRNAVVSMPVREHLGNQ